MDQGEVFRRFHEAWSERDLERVLELSDPEIVCRPIFGTLFSRLEYHGHDGVEQWFREMHDPWDGFETVVEEVHRTPDGVVGFLHLVGHRGEEVFDARVASFAEIREGRIAALTARDVWEAQEALSASDGS